MVSDRLPFPRPRHAEWGTGTTPRDTAVDERETADLPEQGYAIDIGEGGVSLRFRDEAGRRYGRQILAQLRRRSAFPNCRIIDHPDFETRGFMLDISRDRVPTRETLEHLVERLATLRYNHLQLYTEHTFAFREHEIVWRAASPMTPDDVRWLDALCAKRGIELAANQNVFGHMERWLTHEAYRARAETPDGFEIGGSHRGPSALAPTPENAEFALALLRELLPNFESRRINIGCDEVWEMGQGASAAEVAQRGKDAVFVEHLRRIADPLLEQGYEVQFWADMVQRAPEAARTGLFQGRVRVPAEWAVTEGFPTGLALGDEADVYAVALSVVPSVVTLRARADGRWGLALPLVLDLVALGVLLVTAVAGWRHMREPLT